MNSKKSIMKKIATIGLVFLAIGAITALLFSMIANLSLIEIASNVVFWLTSIEITVVVFFMTAITKRLNSQNGKSSAKKKQGGNVSFIGAETIEWKTLPLRNTAGIIVGTELINERNKKGVTEKLVTTTVDGSNALAFATNKIGAEACFLDENIIAQSLAAEKSNLCIFSSDVELFEKHADGLEKEGYDVYLLNFDEPFRSNRWNPFDVLKERIKLITEFEKSLKNQSGTYHTVRESFQTYKDARTRLDELYTELQSKIRSIVETVFHSDSNECKARQHTSEFIVTFIVAMSEDCISGKFGVEKINLLNVRNNLQKYMTENIPVLKRYLVDSRDSHSKARPIVEDLFFDNKKMQESVADVKEAFSPITDSVTTLTCCGDVDVLSNRPKAIFIVSSNNVSWNGRLVDLFMEQLYDSAADKRFLRMTEPEIHKTAYFFDGFFGIPYWSRLNDALKDGESKVFMAVRNKSDIKEKYDETDAMELVDSFDIKCLVDSMDIRVRNEFYDACKRGKDDDMLMEIINEEELSGDGNLVVYSEKNHPTLFKVLPSYKLKSVFFVARKSVSDLDIGFPDFRSAYLDIGFKTHRAKNHKRERREVGTM